MVIFEADRPVRCEAILKADTQGSAPARRTRRDQTDSGRCIENVKAIAGNGRTALDVKQRRIPRPTDLGGEKADSVSFHAGREGRIEHANARAAEVGPIALRFQSEHKLIRLPAISDLAAD